MLAVHPDCPACVEVRPAGRETRIRYLGWQEKRFPVATITAIPAGMTIDEKELCFLTMWN